MYLTRRKYIGANYKHRNVTGKAEIMIGDKKIPIDFEKLSYIEEQACYWRKANQIHKWFVDKVQNGNDDCRTYDVSVKDLEELLDLCKQVKEKAVLTDGNIKNGMEYKDGEWKPIIEKGKYILNSNEIASLLPTEDGFFYGSTDYDEYYMSDIDHTIEEFEKILKEEKELNENGFYSEFTYRSSW